MPQQFYKTTFTLEIVSLEPISEYAGLENLVNLFQESNKHAYSMTKSSEEIITPEDAAQDIQAMEYSLECFGIDENGNDFFTVGDQVEVSAEWNGNEWSCIVMEGPLEGDEPGDYYQVSDAYGDESDIVLVPAKYLSF